MTAFSNQAYPADLEGPINANEIRPELREIPEGIVLRSKTPRGYQVVFKPKEEYKCFTTLEWNSMGFVITDYRWFFNYSLKLEAKLEVRQKQITNRQEQIVDFKKQITLLTDSQKFLQQMLNAEHKMLVQEKEKQAKNNRRTKFTNGLHWGVHGLQLVINSVLTIILATK